MHTNFRHFALIVLFQCAALFTFAQTFSPYSQYGLGKQANPVFSSNKGMGSIGAGYAESRTINFINPASYASLKYTVFSLGANVNGNILSTDSIRLTDAANGGVNHMAFGFPVIQNRWGMSFGLLPYSNVNYTFSEAGELGDINYTTNSTGKGSTYQFYLGNGVKFGNFSAGLNASVIFGNLDYTSSVQFPDSVNSFNTLTHNQMVLRDVTFNLGLQYRTKLSKLENEDKNKIPVYMTAGVYGAPPVRIDAFLSNYTEATVTSVISGNEIPVDTILGAEFDKYGRVTTPGFFGAGVTFGNELNWTAGIDFHYENWKNFKSPLNANSMVNDWKVKIGGQITPDYKSDRLGAKMEYRLGAHFGKSRVNVENTALPDFGMSFGLGLPFKKRSAQSGALSKLNMTFELGRLGLNKENVLKENYYQLTIGYSLSDIWFIKRKFD